MDTVDMIAFGAHPDDVEIGAGGLVAGEAAKGYRIGIVDLTRGEMGSRGTVTARAEQAKRGAELLGCVWRKSLAIPDRHITVNDDTLAAVVRILRQYRPRIIIAPYWVDRHPDHIKASELIKEAHFASGLVKFCPDLPPYRPPYLFHYFINKTAEPSFGVDISDWHDRKKEAVLAHVSQFAGNYPYGLESRERYFGSQIHRTFGEGYISSGPLIVNSPLSIWGERR